MLSAGKGRTARDVKGRWGTVENGGIDQNNYYGKCLQCHGVLCFIPPMPQHPPMPQDLIRFNADLIINYIASFFFFFFYSATESKIQESRYRR